MIDVEQRLEVSEVFGLGALGNEWAEAGEAHVFPTLQRVLLDATGGLAKFVGQCRNRANFTGAHRTCAEIFTRRCVHTDDFRPDTRPSWYPGHRVCLHVINCTTKNSPSSTMVMTTAAVPIMSAAPGLRTPHTRRQ